MATDIRLDEGDGTVLVLVSRVLKAEASDFMLDSEERRKGGGPHRRALVHDQNDGLTINFANDYKGGVTLNAVREITPHQQQSSRGVGIALVDAGPVLVVRGGIEFEVHSLPKFGGDGGGVTTLNLQGELKKLQTQISALAAKLAALESK
jgi:hypothetical protein